MFHPSVLSTCCMPGGHGASFSISLRLPWAGMGAMCGSTEIAQVTAMVVPREQAPQHLIHGLPVAETDTELCSLLVTAPSGSAVWRATVIARAHGRHAVGGRDAAAFLERWPVGLFNILAARRGRPATTREGPSHGRPTTGHRADAGGLASAGDLLVVRLRAPANVGVPSLLGAGSNNSQ